MNVNTVCKGIQEFIFSSLDSASTNNFRTSLINPFIKTAIENNFYKAENILKAIADKDGNIDIEKLINDIISSTLNGKQGTLDLGDIGTVDIGGGCIKLNIPILNTYYKFDSKDFIELKNKLIENYGS